MFKKNLKELLFLLFFLSTTLITLALFFQKQSLVKRAQEGPLLVEFDSTPGRLIKRIWPNFAQGGEEKEAMLSPAKKEIQKLQPSHIRIDHLFDYGVTVQKDSSGKTTFDFTKLDQRIEELLSLGATPFLSLTYFPQGISNDPTEFPQTLGVWQNLVQNTVQRYSGKSQKNIPNIYYEVWNEPDLFGKMDPQKYFSLYRSSVRGAQFCQNCQPFKIGGPAITTLKNDWLNNFLGLVEGNHLRLDFISWHSYQTNPAKTLNEAQSLLDLSNFQRLKPTTEIIISEAGSLPEVSPLHDSYFDASHIISSIALLEDSIDKLFTFELKDGPDPQGNKFWGRWGLLTHQSFGLSAKPKFYSFLYLNKLLEYKLNLGEISPGVRAIGSTNGKSNFSILVTRPGGIGTLPLTLKIKQTLPGTYLANIYQLSYLSKSLLPVSSQEVFNGGNYLFNLTAPQDSTFLLELNRISPATIKTTGKSDQEGDWAAKQTSFLPPLAFNLKSNQPINSFTVSFWFKPTWNETDPLAHTLLQTKDPSGNGFAVWIEPNTLKQGANLGTISNNQVKDKIQIPLPGWDFVSWHKLTLVFDQQNKVLGLKIDDEQGSLPTMDNLALGNVLFFGADYDSKNSAEGAFDDININLNSENYYFEDFNH